MSRKFNQYVFRTERLLVRHYNAMDNENFFLLNSNEDVMRYIRAAQTREQTDMFLREVIAYSESNPGMGRMAVEDRETCEFVGSFALIPVEGKKDMQLGYSFLPEHWGKGYATELAVHGLKHVFDHTKLEFIYAYTEKPNLPSQKVLLKSGFTQLGHKMEGEKELVEFIYYRKDWVDNLSH
jgi:[ribosomal protein S5]-alanine N-acetyltransferase